MPVLKNWMTFAQRRTYVYNIGISMRKGESVCYSLCKYLQCDTSVCGMLGVVFFFQRFETELDKFRKQKQVL